MAPKKNNEIFTICYLNFLWDIVLVTNQWQGRRVPFWHFPRRRFYVAKKRSGSQLARKFLQRANDEEKLGQCKDENRLPVKRLLSMWHKCFFSPKNTVHCKHAVKKNCIKSSTSRGKFILYLRWNWRRLYLRLWCKEVFSKPAKNWKNGEKQLCY